MSNKRTYNYLFKEKAIPCPAGDRYKDKNILIQNGNNYSLKKVDRIDTVEQIQSHLDGVSLNRMIERFKRGDSTALSRGSGFYGDVSGFSDDPHEVIENARSVVAEFGKKDEAAAQDPAPIAEEKQENNSENGKEIVVNAES